MSKIISGDPTTYPASVAIPSDGRIIVNETSNGGTPAMRGQNPTSANSNESGIQNSVIGGTAPVQAGEASTPIPEGAPYRHPVNGINPANPIRK